MSITKFIHEHPFPPDGEEQNNKIVADIQNPAKKRDIRKNLKKLFELNARLIPIIYSQYNYNQSIESIASFVYEGLKKAAMRYDPKKNCKYYIYAVWVIRGSLQDYSNYHDSIVHVPVVKKHRVDKKTLKESGVRITYVPIDAEDCYEAITYDEDEKDPRSEELDMIIGEYENSDLSEQHKKDLEIFKNVRIYGAKNTAKKLCTYDEAVRQASKRATARIIQFRANMDV